MLVTLSSCNACRFYFVWCSICVFTQGLPSYIFIKTYGKCNCSVGTCLRKSKIASNNSRMNWSTFNFCNPRHSSKICFLVSCFLTFSDISSKGSWKPESLSVNTFKNNFIGQMNRQTNYSL